MKFTLAFILFIIFFSNSAFSKEEWKKYEYSNSKFKIEFPQSPEYTIDTNSIDSVRTFYTHNWSLSITDSTHPNFSYIITASEFPKDYIHSDSSETFIDEILTSTQSEFLDNPNLELNNSSLIEYNGYPGKEYKWTNNEDNYYITMRVYLIQNRLYFLSVFKNYGEQHNLLASNFFDSFEVIDIPKGSYSLPKDNDEASYEVNFTDTPKFESKIMESEYGNLVLKTFMLEKVLDGDTLIFFASETNYKKDIIDKNNIVELHQLYKNSVDKSLKAVSGILISLNDTYYNYNLGKEYKGYMLGGARLMTARIYYINQHYYTVFVITKTFDDSKKHVKNFLDSFKLKKIKQ